MVKIFKDHLLIVTLCWLGSWPSTGLSAVPLPMPTTETRLEKQWGDKSARVIEAVISLYHELMQVWAAERLKSDLSDLDFANELIVTNKIFAVNLHGKAELNIIDDQPFVRVTHNRTEISFLIIEENTIVLDSPHFRQYLARQHIDAGSSRSDGQHGRDVVIISRSQRLKEVTNSQNPIIAGKNLDDEAIFFEQERYQKIDRPSPFSTRWWESYAQATYKPPSLATAKFGIFCGIAQGLLGLCVAGMKKLVDPALAMQLAPAYLSAVWGSVIGFYVSTYKNWINRGSIFSRTMKSSVNGLLFGYSLVALIHPSGIEAFSILDPAGVLLHGSIISNVVANNFAKIHWNDFVRVRELIGISRKKLAIKLTASHVIRTDISQAAAENQAIYLAPFSIRLFDLVDSASATFSLGKLILWSSVPIVEYAVLQYTKYLVRQTEHPKASELYGQQQRAWNLKKKLLMDARLGKLLFGRMWLKLRGQTEQLLDLENKLVEAYPELFLPSFELDKGTNKKLDQFIIPEHGLAADGLTIPPNDKELASTSCQKLWRRIFNR